MSHIDGLVDPIELPWILCEKYGWTLEYVEALSMDKLHEFLKIQDGLTKASKSIIKR